MTKSEEKKVRATKKIRAELLDELLEGTSTPEQFFGAGGLLARLSGALVERILHAELDSHLKHAEPSSNNRSNGSSPKTLHTENGPVPLDTPRDRDASFEPIFLPKRQSRVPGLDEKILYLYSLGNSTRDIQSVLNDLYHTDISHELISSVTESVADELSSWRKRPLQKAYAAIWIDGLFIKVKEERMVQSLCIYLIVGMNFQGKKEILGLYAEKTEGAKYWLSILNDLKNRGMEDVLFVCCDGLTGLPEAIRAIFPKSAVQLCIVHQVRNSLRYAPQKEKKEMADALKAIYQASNEEIAKEEFVTFSRKYEKKYPRVVESWKSKWNELSVYLGYSPELRNMIYTTNAIESANYQIMKVIKNKGHFPSQESAERLIFMALQKIEKKWSTHAYPLWGLISEQLALLFGARVPSLGTNT